MPQRIFCFALSSCLAYLLAARPIYPAPLSGAEDNNTASGDLIRFQGPEQLRFDDLVTLAEIDPPPAELPASHFIRPAAKLRE
jgi:hypothetical protein